MLAWAFFGPPAAADTRSIEARGQAPAGSESARVAAIDAALAEAVSQILGELVTPELRRRHGKVLTDEVIKRARRYVASFTVVDENEAEGTYHVRVKARVDLDKLGAALGELGIAAGQVQASPGARTRPRVVVLVHASLGNTVTTTFGESKDEGGPPGRALMTAVRERGFEIASAQGASLPIAAEAPQGVPVSDQAAAEIARKAGAGGAFVIGLQAEVDGPIRGTSQTGARGRASMRVLELGDAGMRLVFQDQVKAAGFADSADDALAQTSLALVSRLVQAMTRPVADHWPLVRTSDDVLLVDVQGFQAWQPVRALVDYLAGTRGITRVWPRHVGKSGVILAVDTELDRKRVASALRRAQIAGGELRIDNWDDRGLRVTISGQEGSKP